MPASLGVHGPGDTTMRAGLSSEIASPTSPEAATSGAVRPVTRWFESVDDARQTLQDWRRDYNEVRPHSSLGDLPPAAFAAQIQAVGPELCSQG